MQWTWTWANSERWWGAERPGVLWFMGSQRVGHDWATDLIWSDAAEGVHMGMHTCVWNIYIHTHTYLCTCMLSHSGRIWLYNPTDCSWPGSSVHGILHARILAWVAMPSSRGSFQPRDRTLVSCVYRMASRFFTTEPLGKLIHTHTHTHTHIKPISYLYLKTMYLFQWGCNWSKCNCFEFPLNYFRAFSTFSLARFTHV